MNNEQAQAVETASAVTLRPDDARAVDLLLDLPDQSMRHQHSFSTDEDLAPRAAAAERLLGLLRVLPTPDPTEDLVQRTLRRVEEAADIGVPAPASAAATITGSIAGPTAHSASPPDEA
jgi:hypothetical protein